MLGKVLKPHCVRIHGCIKSVMDKHTYGQTYGKSCVYYVLFIIMIIIDAITADDHDHHFSNNYTDHDIFATISFPSPPAPHVVRKS